MSHPQITQRVVSRGRRALVRSGTQIDPMTSLRNVVIRGLSAGARMLCGQIYTPAGLVIDSDLHNTLRYE
jgi:hypothetical protein